MLTSFMKSIIILVIPTKVTMTLMMSWIGLKRKKFDYKEFELGSKKDKDSKLTVLPEWLSSRNDFNEAIKLIENIRADTNNVTSSSGDKKVFNDLNELINDIRIKKLHGKVSLKKYGALFLI